MATLNEYREQLKLMEQGAVSGSLAYGVVYPITNALLFWTNQLTGLRISKPGGDTRTYTPTIVARLHRALLTQGQQTEDLEALCWQDVETVIEYFEDHLTLTTANNVPPAGIVPKSLTIEALGVGELEQTSRKMIGSIYRINFSYMKPYSRRG